MNRDEALQWCVDNLDEWPLAGTLASELVRAPQGWDWFEFFDKCKLEWALRSTDEKFKRIHMADYKNIKDEMRAPVVDHEGAKRKCKIMNRLEALEWCARNFTLWPENYSTSSVMSKPTGWEWTIDYNNNQVILARQDGDGNPIFKYDWTTKRAILKESNEPVVELPTPYTGAIPLKNEIEQPSHYELLDGEEVIDVIHNSLTEQEFRGYCLGNILKYRLRAGKKGTAETCIKKADEYVKIYKRFTD